MAPVATSTSITALWLRSPECGVGTLAIAIVLPSGDHASGDEGAPGGKLTGKLQLPDVRRRAAVAPSLGTSHTCVGVGAVATRKSSLPTSNESLNRSGPVFFSASSAVAYTIVDPSGDQAYCCTPFGAFVMRLASPPVIASTNTCRCASRPVPTLARNASRSPPGDQRGWPTPRRSDVSGRSVPESTSTSVRSAS